jgi:hypothetical protein
MTPNQKLAQFTEQQIRKHASVMLVQQNDGSVLAFGKYFIRQAHGQVTVSTWDRKQGDFTSRKSALAWCSADRKNFFKLAQNIQRLDQRCLHLNHDLQARTALLNKSQDPAFRENVRTKITSKQNMLHYIQAELENCLNRAKYIELKDFQNEAARIFSDKPSQAR